MVKKESNPIVMFFKRRAVRIVGIIGLSFVILYASAFTAIFLDSTLKNPEQIKFVTDPVAMKQCISNNEQIRMFTIFFFVLLLLGIITLLVGGKSSFKVDMIEITPEIRTPAPAGQGQHGTAKWLPKEKFDQVFDSDIIDSKKLMQGKESFSAGGLVLGKEDIKTSIFSKRVKEKIYHITKDLHALIIGATRSGKTRCIVIQTIIDLILAGENVVVPDLKGELRDYTEDVAKKYGYEVIGIDFIHPYQSKRRNFLEPVIKALQRNDISRAIEETWSLVSQLVGEPPENGEKLWNNGEAATLAASIMAVCYDNQDHPEYQNLTNVFYFITEMCSDYRGALPLQFYIDSLPEEHPAKILLAATKVAAMRTRSSFYVSAIMTLKLLTIPAINQMTNASDFDIEKLIDEGKKVIIYLGLPARDKTYFPLASLFLRQISDLIDYVADEKYGGRVPVRWNFIDEEMGNFTKITNMRQQTSFGTGKGIRHFMFIQSYAQLDDVYGEKVSQIIQDNANIKIYLRSPNPTTKKKISEDLGNYTTRSYSKSNNTPSGTFRNGGSDGESSNLMGRPLLYPDEVGKLQRPYSLVMSDADPAIMYAPDLSQYAMNEFLGMGDEEHNNRLRQRKAEEHKKNERPHNSKMELWGIWDVWKKHIDAQILKQQKEKAAKAAKK
ncbi:type IV secretory system conjugative DNA transfer family protein [Anaerostipes hadrus]|uniref:type IV secretory system conjugative DNA transfer family protein n=1 Tax=Anaerostipes hadrus TaxID=649756 RepID=UPI001D097083|nr:type IV secretory system conjugative DNA transfer family protein [Anaerostipes hadrus]MCB6170051.1 type IV secretory system conjugative DNA transfer family protein [Anaerostipes hadrus]MCB6653849.1 type IV secretory system conjugative DNA transfer family protein [Anaerostipes hadrus]MCB6655257.1 type IV secretory system conjugative DNA transfer family protein [Anaerostipes hadrus]MCB6680342.1 type IV secretory system conjugative DNA transfer family protein [Anaerostipes hadrus]MCB6743682.1 